VVLAAVAQNGNALVFASVDLKANKDVVLAAVEQNGEALFRASEYLTADKEVVLAAVTQRGKAVKFASDELRLSDNDVALAAVAQDGAALELTMPRVNFQTLVRDLLAAHAAFVTFLLAAQPSSIALQPPPATRPAPWILEGLGEDAGRHVRVATHCYYCRGALR